MVSFISVVLVSLVLALDDLEKVGALPAGLWYDCSASGLNNAEACSNTRWCMWSTLGSGSCVYDECLKWLDNTGQLSDCPTQNQAGNTISCGLYYITDTHNCTTGAVIEQSDRYCRSVDTGILKKPVDPCFYQDLKARYETTPRTLCDPVPGAGACAAVGTPGGADNYYCYETGDKSCLEYLEDSDIVGFCNCLTPKNCYLYPYCTQNRAGDRCVVDPCGQYTPLTGSTTCQGTTCGYKAAQKVTDSGALTVQGLCITNESTSGNNLKVNDWNQCFFGIQSTLTYVNNSNPYPECATVDEVSNCTGIPIPGSDKTCQPYPIVANFFVGKEANYCSDEKDTHIPPAPGGAGSIIRIPTLIALFLLAVAVAL